MFFFTNPDTDFITVTFFFLFKGKEQAFTSVQNEVSKLQAITE